MKKTIGQLVDELSVTNIKIFMMVEKIEEGKNTKEDAQKMQTLIKYRSQLTNAINAEFGSTAESTKVYQGK
jgi:hypothetical protein